MKGSVRLSQKKLRLVHLVYAVALSVLVCAVLACMLAGCISIYKSGERAFTPESIGLAFSKFAWLVYITVAFIFGGAILNTVAPIEKKKLKGEVNQSLVVERLGKRLGSAPAPVAAKIKQQRLIRLGFIISCAIFLCIATVLSLVYALNKDNFASEDVNSQIIKANLTFLRYYLLPLIYTIVTAYVCKSSLKKELALIKEAMKSKNSSSGEELCPVVPNECPVCRGVRSLENKPFIKKYGNWIVRGVIICAGIVFVICGIVNGGMNDVVQKAIKICTECIGLG